MLLLNKILLMDLFRQKKQSGAISMNNLQGCFDRISNIVEILVLMSFGLAHTAAKVLFEVLQFAEHRIKTGIGISKPAYGIASPPLVGMTRRQQYAKNLGSFLNKATSANVFVSAHHKGALNRLYIESISEFQIYTGEIERIMNPSPYNGNFAKKDEAFQTLKECNRILIDEYKLPEDKFKVIANAIIDGTAREISDWSFRPDVKKGASAFIITPGKNYSQSIGRQNWVPGRADDQGAFRSELSGVLGIESSLAIIVKFHNIREGSIEIACDSQSTVNEVDNDDVYLYCEQKSFDMLQDIHQRIKLLLIDI